MRREGEERGSRWTAGEVGMKLCGNWEVRLWEHWLVSSALYGQ